MGNGKKNGNGRTILVVDDEPHVIKSLSFVLTKEGYEVASAENGEDALVKIQHLKPGLVFLDVMMPRKNGYEVCQEVKKDPALGGVYIIMLTAKGQEADREQGLSAGADEFMSKPFSPMGVVEKVRELLG